MSSKLEPLTNDANSPDDMGKSPSRSRRELLSMLLLAPLAIQGLEGCDGNSSSDGNGGGGSTATGLPLNLSPQNPQVMAGTSVTFSITAPAGVMGTLEYDWTQTSTFATLSTPEATGNKLTTPDTSVQLITTPSDSAPITVTVTAYQLTSSGRTQVGSASTTVTVLTTLPANTMFITSTDPNIPANNFTLNFPVSAGIDDGGIPGTWIWEISDLGDPSDYPFQVRIQTAIQDELAPPAGSSSVSVPYAAANTSPAWQLIALNSNAAESTGSPLVVARTPNPSGGYTYNVSFSAGNHTQMLSGMATFDISRYPAM